MRFLHPVYFLLFNYDETSILVDDGRRRQRQGESRRRRATSAAGGGIGEASPDGRERLQPAGGGSDERLQAVAAMSDSSHRWRCARP